MAFTISDMTPDTRPWRVNWFGELVYPNNGRRRTQPVYKVLSCRSYARLRGISANLARDNSVFIEPIYQAAMENAMKESSL